MGVNSLVRMHCALWSILLKLSFSRWIEWLRCLKFIKYSSRWLCNSFTIFACIIAFIKKFLFEPFFPCRQNSIFYFVFFLCNPKNISWFMRCAFLSVFSCRLHMNGLVLELLCDLFAFSVDYCVCSWLLTTAFALELYKIIN